MNNLLLPNGTSPLADSAARALQDMLKEVPKDTATVLLELHEGGTVRVSAASRIAGGDDWELAAGGFYERSKTSGRKLGVGVSISW